MTWFGQNQDAVGSDLGQDIVLAAERLIVQLPQHIEESEMPDGGAGIGVGTRGISAVTMARAGQQQRRGEQSDEGGNQRSQHPWLKGRLPAHVPATRASDCFSVSKLRRQSA